MVSIGGSFPTMAGLGILAATFALMWWLFKWALIGAVLALMLVWTFAVSGLQWVRQRHQSGYAGAPH